MTLLFSSFFRPPDGRKNLDLMNYSIHPSDWPATCHSREWRSSRIHILKLFSQRGPIGYCFIIRFVSASFHSWLANLGHATISGIVTVLLAHGARGSEDIEVFGDLSFIMNLTFCNLAQKLVCLEGIEGGQFGVVCASAESATDNRFLQSLKKNTTFSSSLVACVVDESHTVETWTSIVGQLRKSLLEAMRNEKLQGTAYDKRCQCRIYREISSTKKTHWKI